MLFLVAVLGVLTSHRYVEFFFQQHQYFPPVNEGAVFELGSLELQATVLAITQSAAQLLNFIFY
ncbi:hypothetical protein T11_17336 [Trichinella zimbabwensis]|uniref:Uncharacterized protein n=1 Tax=Trichinella zimbabwensis TaxID=268475 RepID=A0A0V1GX99_9BILA|nr:hypothetical protein T11_17336 [Trichinella zimbabwensis]